MRIGFDLLALQTSSAVSSRALDLLRIIEADHDDEWIHYLRGERPAPEGIPGEVRVLHRVPSHTSASVGDRLVAQNPDRLDALVILDPCAVTGDDLPPEVPLGVPGRPALVAIVWEIPASARVRRTLSRYDALIAGSEAIRREIVRDWDIVPDRVAVRGDSPRALREVIVAAVSRKNHPARPLAAVEVADRQEYAPPAPQTAPSGAELPSESRGMGLIATMLGRLISPVLRAVDRRVHAWFLARILPKVRLRASEATPALEGLVREVARLQRRVDALEAAIADRQDEGPR